MRARVAVALSTVTALAFAGLVATPAHAAVFPVATEAELIAAINDANLTVAPDIIQLTGANLTLTADLPDITAPLTITGPGSGAFTIDAAGFSVFRSIGSGTNTQFSASGIRIENAGSFVVDTDDLDVVLADLVVESGIEHSFGDFSATDIDILGVPSVEGMFLVFNGSDDVELTRVTVTATPEEGIDISASGDATVTLTDVSVINSATSGYDGLSANVSGNARLDVMDSEFSSNGSDGILVEAFGNAVVVLDNVTADDNPADGIDVDADDDSMATVRDSSAADNGDSGFESEFEGGTGLFENVTAERNGDDGFDVESDFGATATLTNPVAIDNVGHGVMVEPDTSDSTSIVTGGRGEGNGSHGLFLNVDEGSATSTGFVSRNNAEGGVLIDGYNGQATLRNATITDNNEVDLTPGGGVDIEAYDDGIGPLDVLIEGSTISSNMAGLFGGGISGTVDDGSTVTIRNSTISGNEAPNAGAITLESTDDSELTIEHSTITQNETTNENQEAVLPVGMAVTISHSIIAGNLGPGPAVDLGEDTSTLDIEYSLVQTADANSLVALAAGTGNIVGQAAGLGPLANNGGATRTHVPLAGSAAMSAGNAAIVGAPATDQRGDDRIVGVIEIGSVEVQDPELAATGATNGFTVGAAGLALLLVMGGALLMVLRRNSRESITR